VGRKSTNPMPAMGPAVERIAKRSDMELALGVNDVSLTDNDVARGSVKRLRPSTKGNVSVSESAERRAKVEQLLLLGYQSKQIAAILGVDAHTVQRDIEYLDVYLSKRYDTEKLRSMLTAKMLDLAQVADTRYREGESTVEGRLVIDATARIAKLHGLDETQTQAELGGALARLLGMAGDDE
jgi:hypothetical protein